MRRRLLLVALYLLAAVAGVAATFAFLRSPLLGSQVRAGAWSTSRVSGSTEADAYTRAKVARIALLALSREETLYYVAEHDDAGRPLRSRCRYRVEGLPPPARWWSVTAYADDYFLFPDDQHRYSVNGARATFDEQGRFVLAVGGADPADGRAWLPTPGDRGLVLTLRLYNPAAELAADPARLAPPSIRAEGGCA